MVLLFAAPQTADAQARDKVYRIGLILTAAPNEVQHVIEALDEGLRELGYVEGRNLVMDRRFAEEKQERLPGIAAELVRRKVDVIVTGSKGARVDTAPGVASAGRSPRTVDYD
jgi:putative ABC transport system substrate-binding protein